MDKEQVTEAATVLKESLATIKECWNASVDRETKIQWLKEHQSLAVMLAGIIRDGWQAVQMPNPPASEMLVHFETIHAVSKTQDIDAIHEEQTKFFEWASYQIDEINHVRFEEVSG